MSHARPSIALGSRSFGRGRAWLLPKAEAPTTINGDLKLFVTTFVAGFLFVSLLLA